MLQTLDVALGLSFIFFLFSVLVSTTSEMILSWGNARGKMLWKALAHMLPEGMRNDTLTPLNDFVQHPLMAAMHRNPPGDSSMKNFPSYLSNTQFSQVLMDILETKGTGATGAETTWEQVRAGINRLDEGARGPLQALSRDAERNLLPGQEPSSVFHLVRQWFDGMMDRSTGWYKRLTQIWNFGLGIALAIACNLNVIAITRALSTNDELRTAFVQKAQASVQAQSDLVAKMGVEQSQGARAVFDDAVKEISDAGFPVGWSVVTTKAWKTHPVGTFFESILGWLMAGAAAALGAQFWFDLMKKIINMRGTGAKPESGQNVPLGEAGMTGPIPPAGLIIDGTESRQ